MFDDPKQELKHLEEQLLEGEDSQWLHTLEEARQLLEQEDSQAMPPLPEFHGGNTDRVDVDLERYSDEIHDAPLPKKKGTRGLLIFIGLELLGILGILGYWALMLL